jgi:hypothetical protein
VYALVDGVVERLRGEHVAQRDDSLQTTGVEEGPFEAIESR